ncbi:MAG: hypothetical protein IJ325_13250, partial [Clostridia bacterium]|nr:hypothetical protein [Clostridia bacterium]
MINVASNLALGILTNTVYDVVKYTGEKFANRKKDRELQEIVEQVISESIPEELSRLLESSTFVSYFDSPQFLDVLNTYIEQKIICEYSCQNANIPKPLKKGGTISMTDVIEYISQNIHAAYMQDGVAVIPPLGDIRAGVKYVLHVTEEAAARSISPETSKAVFFLNSRMDTYYEDIKSVLLRLQKKTDQLCARQLAHRDGDYQEIKAKYHSVLQEKNS